MSGIDKIKNKVGEVLGQAKEKIGKVTDNENLEAEGKKDQTKSSLKDIGESVKDVFKK